MPTLAFSTGLHEQMGAQAYIDHVQGTHGFLAKQSDFSPRNQTLTTVLHNFVRDTMKPRSRAETESILAAPRIQEIAPDLRRLLSRAEYEMECFCARAMVGREPGAEHRFSSYDDFIYRDNYEALIDAELDAMKYHIKAPPLKQDRESVAFVGAGSLPISPIMIHKRTGLQVTCIDSDEQACLLGRQLVRHMAATDPAHAGLDKQIHFVHAAGEDHDYVTHPIVFIASLVERKDPVVMRIVETSHTVATTIIRSAEGLSTLLYQPENCVAGQEEYNSYLVGQTKPTADAINNSLVYKFPPGKCWRRNKIELAEQPDDMARLRPQPKRMWRTGSLDISI